MAPVAGAAGRRGPDRPGPLGDQFLLRTLTKIASGDDPSFRGQTDLENQTANLDSPTSLMQRISAAASVTGMHFAGVPMTVQKAVSVGSVVFYVASSWQRSF